MRHLFVIFFILWLHGCEDRFRYDCQSPENWTKKECQKPYCIPFGTCTEYLIKTEEEKCK